MIGRLDRSVREATVIGAGISGLLVAYRLHRQGYKVTVLEAKDRAGGMIETKRTPYGIAESAAHSFLVTPRVQSLFDEVGVGLLPIRKDSRARFVLRNGKMSKFPLTFVEAIDAFRRVFFRKATFPEDVADDDVTIEQWGEECLGRGAVDYLLCPFVLGIYGSLPFQLGVNATFPMLPVPRGETLLAAFRRGRRGGGGEKKKRGPRPMMAPTGGIGAFVGALDRILSEELGPRFKKGEAVRTLPDVPNLILCVDPHSAGALLEGKDASLARALRAVEFSRIISVTAVLDKSGFAKDVKGVGVLVPQKENRTCMGILFNSSSFAGRVNDEARYASLTLMLGGASRPEFVRARDSDVDRVVRQSLHEILGYRGELVHTTVHRWERAIPVYSPSLQKLWKQAAGGWCVREGRMLFGNYTGQVSLRGMIESALTLAQE